MHQLSTLYITQFMQQALISKFSQLLLGTTIAACLPLAAVAAPEKKLTCAMATEGARPQQILEQSADCLDKKKMPQALVLYHLGMLRMDVSASLLEKDRELNNDRVLMAAAQAVMERPLFQWAAGDVPAWIELIGQAMAKDEAMPMVLTNGANVEVGTNGQDGSASKVDDAHNASRLNLMVLTNELRNRRESIYTARASSKMDIRDKSWSPKRTKEAVQNAGKGEGKQEDLANSGHSGHRHE